MRTTGIRIDYRIWLLFLVTLYSLAFPRTSMAKEEISVAYCVDCIPFQYKDRSKQPTGILIDFWKLWSERTGTKVKFVPATWTSTLEMVKHGQADAHAGLFFNTERDAYLEYGVPLTETETHIFLHKTLPPLNELEEASAYRIGVLAGDYVENYLKERLPNATIVAYPDYISIMEALKHGQLRAFAADTPTGIFHLKAHGLLGSFTYFDNQKLYENHWFVAAKEGATYLISEINQGMALISNDEKRDILRQWSGDATDADDDTMIIAVPRNRAPLAFLNDSGQATGLLIDLWSNWAEKTGQKIRFRSSSWDDAIGAVLSGEADLHSGISNQHKASSEIKFSKSIYSLETHLYHLARQGVPHDLNALSGSTLGVMQDSTQQKFLELRHPTIQVKAFTNAESMINALLNNEVTGLLGHSLILDDIITKRGLRGEISSSESSILNTPIYAAYLLGNDYIATLVAQGLKQVSKNELASIEENWIPDPKRRLMRPEHSTIELSPDEAEWLKTHRKVRVHNEKDWPPFNFFNNGLPQGYSIDFMNLLAEKLGLEVEYVTGPTWSEFLGMMKTDDLDIMLNIVKTPERLKYISYTQPYASNPNTILSLKSKPYSDLEQLVGKTVAVTRGFFYEEIIRRDHPGVNLLLTKNTEEAMKAVSFGTADAAVGELAVFDYLIADNMMTGLMVSGEFKVEDQDISHLRVAVAKDNPLMRSILSKGMAAITPEETRDLKKRWLGDTETEQATSVQLTKEEQAWIKQNPDVRIAAINDWPPFEMGDTAAEYQGISAEVVRRAATRVGLNVIPVIAPWPDHIEALKAGTIDFAPGMFVTEERKGYLNFTKPWLEVYDVVITRGDTDNITSVDDLEDKVVAVEDGFYTHEILKTDYPKSKLLPVANTLEALKAVLIGKADAYVGNQFVASHLINKHVMHDLHAIGYFGERARDIVVGVPKNRPLLHSIFDKALATINTHEKQAIIKSYGLNTEVAPPRNSVELTEAENAWLNQHPVIRLGVDPDYPPFVFTDQQGEFAGITSDYLRIVGERLGIQFEMVEGLNFQQILQGAKEGTIDLVPAVAQTKERDAFLNFTKPNMDFPAVIITHEDHPLIEGLHDLDKQRVALIEGYAITEAMTSRDDVFEAVITATPSEALQTVAIGGADATVMNLAVATYLIKQHNISGLKIAAPVDLGLTGLGFGVRKDWPELVSILNKGLDSITPKEEFAVRSHWVSVKYQSELDLAWLKRAALQVGVVGGLILLVIIIWNRRLQREVVTRKGVEAHLREARIAADNANSAKSDFLATMSHEMRTPLNAVLGMSHLALQQPMAPQLRDNLNSIQMAAKSLLGIISDVLDLSKIEAGHLELESIAFDIDTMLESTAAVSGYQACNKGLDFNIYVQRDVPRSLIGDPQRISQILLNLAGNASKFTEQGSIEVRVAVASQSADRVNLEFSVKDTGIGLTEEQTHLIFDAFTQADSSTTRRYGGTGLGLHISNLLVKKMSGDMKVKSELRKGSTFAFNVWLYLTENTEQNLIDLTGASTLLVGERFELLGDISDMLQRAGASVMVMPAIASSASLPFDLLVLDIRGATQEQVAQRLSQVPSGTQTLLIHDVTLDITDIEVAQSIHAPITPFSLIRAVARTVGRQIPEHEAASIDYKDHDAYRILLVEDNTINQQVAVGLLQQYHIDVVVASDGQEALDIIEKQTFDLVLMDIQMPGMNGYETTKHIRKAFTVDELPIIAMTAHATEDAKQSCFEAGMNDFIAKPIEPSRLDKLLNQYLTSNKVVPTEPTPEQKGYAFPKLVAIDTGLGLHHTGGDSKLYLKLLKEFSLSHEFDGSKLSDLLENNLHDEARALAHTLKGVAGSLGATELRTQASLMEQCIPGCNAELEDNLKQALHKVLVEITELPDEINDK